jgi:hypothetical protein
MNKNDIDKAYISPYDKMIFEFDATHPKSESQLKEINKHKRIANLRDNSQTEQDSELWEGF